MVLASSEVSGRLHTNNSSSEPCSIVVELVEETKRFSAFVEFTLTDPEMSVEFFKSPLTYSSASPVLLKLHKMDAPKYPPILVEL